MIVVIKRVWNANLDKYKDVLKKYNASFRNESEALIEFNAIEEVFKFKEDLNQDLLFNIHEDNTIEIYDDYIE